MQAKLDIYFPPVIGEIIASFLSNFNGAVSEFSSKDILDRIIVKNDRIFSYGRNLVNVHDLEGNLLFRKSFSYIEYIQVLKDGNLLVITYRGESFLYDTVKWEEISRKEVIKSTFLLVFSSYSSTEESNYYYKMDKYIPYTTRISRVDPYCKENTLVADLMVTGFTFSITEYKDSFYVNSDKIIYYITDGNVKEIPIHFNLVTFIDTTEDGLLYYISSSAEKYYLVISDLKRGVTKITSLSLEKDLYLLKDITLISDKIFLVSRNFTHHCRTLLAIDINTGKLIYSIPSNDDSLRLVGVISGCLVYIHNYDKVYINFVRFNTGELISSYSLNKCLYIDKTYTDRLLFMDKNKIIILG